MSKTLENLVQSGVRLTPMMRQYAAIKKDHLDSILLFRMGDFYEVFFEDATRVSQTLSIALTHRGKLGDTPIPMAGIPHHAASNYIDRLMEAGLKVAICEQVESPGEAKGIVKRAVTQMVTPGIPYDLDKSNAKESRYLVAGGQGNSRFFLVAVDFTTGEFKGQKFESAQAFLEAFFLLRPKELITHMGQWEKIKEIETFCQKTHVLKTHLNREYFDL